MAGITAQPGARRRWLSAGPYGLPTGVPQSRQKPAPAASGEPQAAHDAGAPAAGAFGDVTRMAIGGATGGAIGGSVGARGVRVEAAAWPPPSASVFARASASAAATAAAPTGFPQRGHATYAGSSITVRQFPHRAGANGSFVPHLGQAAASRRM
jgi:hypothetical protein